MAIPVDDAPWLNKKEWAEGRIRSQTGNVAGLLWVIALLWNGFMWPVVVLLWGDPEKSAMLKVLAIFCVVGVLLLFWAIRDTLAWFRFGTSIFELASNPGVIGGALEGRVQTRLKSRPKAPVQVTLSCNRRVTERVRRTKYDDNRNRSGTREETVVRTELLWQGGCKLQPEALVQGPRGLTIPVRIEIPSGSAGTDATDPNDEILWHLGVTVDLPGADFGAAFSVPVFETEDSRSNLTQEMIDEAAEEQGLLSQPSDPGTSWVPPVSVRWTAQGGVEYTFRPATSLKVAVGVSLLTVAVCAGSAWLWVWLEEAGPFALIPAAFGVLLLIATAVVWTFKSRVLVEGKSMKVRKSFLGIPRTWEVPFSDVKAVQVQRSIVEGLDEEDLDWEIVIDRYSEEEARDIGATFTIRAEAVKIAEEMESLIY